MPARTRFAALVAAAAVGATLLLVVATSYWGDRHDPAAYWLAGAHLLSGAPVYDPAASPVAGYVYWNPPVLAQIVAPITAVVPEMAFRLAWVVLQLGCLLFLAGGDLLLALALIAFVPVAVELGIGNLHLQIAVLIVLGLRRSAVWFAVGAALKIGPIVGPVYLAAAGRRREALLALGAGCLLLVVSVALSPGTWSGFLETVLPRVPWEVRGLVDFPYPGRLAAGALLAIVAGRMGGRRGELLLVVAVLLANPTLWLNAFSILIAAVPLLKPRDVPVASPVIAAEPATV